METKGILKLYEARGFEVTRVEAEQDFKCIENDILPVPMNITDADDHVSQVERSIRTIKERMRCTLQGMPFRRIPKVMLRAAIEATHKNLTNFPRQTAYPAP